MIWRKCILYGAKHMVFFQNSLLVVAYFVIFFVNQIVVLISLCAAAVLNLSNSI